MKIANYLSRNNLSSKEVDELYWQYRRARPKDKPQIKHRILVGIMPMFLRIVNNYSLPQSVDQWELIHEIYIQAFHHIDKYKPGKTKLTTFLYHVATWTIKEFLSVKLSQITIPFYARYSAKKHLKKGIHNPHFETVYALLSDEPQYQPVELMNPDDPSFEVKDRTEEDIEQNELFTYLRKTLNEDEYMVIYDFLVNGGRRTKEVSVILKKLKQDPHIREVLYGEAVQD